MHQVQDILSALVPPLFLELAVTTAKDQRAQQADAQLAAALKKQVTLDMSTKALEATLALETPVVHANIEGLIGQVVQKKLQEQTKQEEKAILQNAIKEKIFGRRRGKKDTSKTVAQKARLWRRIRKELELNFL